VKFSYTDHLQEYVKNLKFLHKTEPDSFTRLLLASFQKQDSKAFGVLLPTAYL
jgi:hypothetical protein